MAVDEVVNTGVIVRGQDGKFLPGTRAPGTIKTSEDARNLAQKRWEKARKAAVKRITGEAASIDPTVSTVDDAYGLMLAKQYTTILDSDKPRMDDAEKMGQLLGLAPRNAELRQETQQRTVNDPVGEALLTLIQALTGDNRMVIDADVSDND